ncbi:MAG TPA: alpha/beta fold hydrolase [Acidimicrobiales bacterium]|nr:alpha/beta fold hydrolase [Acidimicrobiales bacterium]
MRLCLVHGFTQTGTSWGPVTERLRARGHDVVTPDVAGHGRAAGARADLWGAAELLAREVGPAVWVGYSLGGRVVLHLALARPDVAERLVLVSTTAGIADAAERADRRRADAELADELERDGVAAFVERWLQGPLWATLPRTRAGVEHRLTNTAAGLASSLRLAGTGAQAPLWDRLPEVQAPVLVVAGGADAKFAALGKELAAVMPRASYALIEGAGHAAPWEQPDRFVEVLDAWLRQGGSPP